MSFSRLAFVMLMLGASVASAEPAPRKPVAKDALARNAHAAKLFATQSFEQAATEYKASYLIEPAPVTDLNLGQCYRILGERTEDLLVRKQNFERALWHYERFIKTSPQTPQLVDQVRGVMETMRTKLAEMGTPPASSPTQPIESPRVQSDRPTSPNTSQWHQDWVGWGLSGSGVVTLGIAGGLFLSASNLREQAFDTPDQQEQNALRDKADTRSLIGTTLTVVAGGLLLSGAIKLVIHSQRVDAHETASWSVGVLPGGFLVFGAF